MKAVSGRRSCGLPGFANAAVLSEMPLRLGECINNLLEAVSAGIATSFS